MPPIPSFVDSAFSMIIYLLLSNRTRCLLWVASINTFSALTTTDVKMYAEKTIASKICQNLRHLANTKRYFQF